MLRAETIERLNSGNLPKGDPLPVARVAAIQAAKNTSAIIPYCHPLLVEFADCRFEILEKKIRITTEVKAIYKTGVEMEALTAATVAALTIYDMVKMVDESAEISEIRLLKKTGGKSDYQPQSAENIRSAVLVLSDSRSSGEKPDRSGQLLCERLKGLGFSVDEFQVIPDEPDLIVETLKRFAEDLKVDLVLTTGGTGIGPRDRTPEALSKIIDREIPGISEALRSYGLERTPFSMLSRGIAGTRGNTLIVSLPGSISGVGDAVNVLAPVLRHAIAMMRGHGHDEVRGREES